MKTRITYKNGFSDFPIFEVIATTNNNNIPSYYKPFKDNIYIAKLIFPIANDKFYRLVGLHGEIQDAFFKTFGTDILFLKNETEIENALKQVIITMNYKIGQYNIVK